MTALGQARRALIDDVTVAVKKTPLLRVAGRVAKRHPCATDKSDELAPSHYLSMAVAAQTNTLE